MHTNEERVVPVFGLKTAVLFAAVLLPWWLLPAAFLAKNFGTDSQAIALGVATLGLLLTAALLLTVFRLHWFGCFIWMHLMATLVLFLVLLLQDWRETWHVPSGPDSGPFPGIGRLFAVGAAIILSILFLWCWFFRPRVWSPRVVGITCFQLLVMAGLYLATGWQIARQDFTVKFLDLEGRPVADVEVDYAVYGVGRKRGWVGRHTYSGTRLARPDGSFTLHSRVLNHETSGSVRKQGYRAVAFKIRSERNQHNNRHSLAVQFPDARKVAPASADREYWYNSAIPKSGQSAYAFRIYLPREEQKPEPLVSLNYRLRWEESKTNWWINIFRGIVTNQAEADLQFLQVRVAPSDPKRCYDWQLEMRGLGSTELVQGDVPYCHRAPVDGYRPLHVEEFFFSSRPETREMQWRKDFFVKARGGRVTVLLRVDYRRLGGASFEIESYANPSGSPVLEPSPALQILDERIIARHDRETMRR